jgi:hypothetical protein
MIRFLKRSELRRGMEKGRGWNWSGERRSDWRNFQNAKT